MKKVCAWCNKQIGSVRVKQTGISDLVTHSICSDCADNLDFQSGVPLQRYLDSLKIPIIALNGDGRIIAVNAEASRTYSEKAGAEKADWPDRVFECAHARLPEGCKNRIHCSGCAIRLVVTESYRTGKSLREIPAFITHCDSENLGKPELMISAESVDKIVFLRMVKL